MNASRADMASAPEIAKLRKQIEEAHFRIDELVREIATLKRLVTPDHLAGLVHGLMHAAEIQR